MKTKKYLIIPILIAVLVILNSCSNNNDLNKFGLNGRVKTYLERHYETETKFGDWEIVKIKDYGHIRMSFDSDGNYEWIEYLDKDSKLSRKLIPKRKNGKIIEESHYNKKGELINVIKIIHHSNVEQEFITYNESGEKESRGKVFLKNGKVIKQESQILEKKNVKKEHTIAYKYDKNGNLICKKGLNKNAEIQYFFKFNYLAFDNYNNWTKRLDYSSEEGEKPNKIVIREYEYH
jgi:hypothetical protein